MIEKGVLPMEEKKRGRGRPKADKPKEIRFSIRLSSESYERLKEYSDRNGLTVTGAINQAIERMYQSSK